MKSVSLGRFVASVFCVPLASVASGESIDVFRDGSLLEPGSLDGSRTVVSVVNGNLSARAVETDSFEISGSFSRTERGVRLEYESDRSVRESSTDPADPVEQISAEESGILGSGVFTVVVDEAADFTFEGFGGGGEPAETLVALERLDDEIDGNVIETIFSTENFITGNPFRTLTLADETIFGFFDGTRSIGEFGDEIDAALESSSILDTFLEGPFGVTGTLPAGAYRISALVPSFGLDGSGDSNSVFVGFRFTADTVSGDGGPVNPPNVIPTPSAAVAGLLGVGLLAARRRRELA